MDDDSITEDNVPLLAEACIMDDELFESSYRKILSAACSAGNNREMLSAVRSVFDSERSSANAEFLMIQCDTLQRLLVAPRTDKQLIAAVSRKNRYGP